MRALNLTKKLFWIIALIIISISLVISFYQYKNINDYVAKRALGRAETLQSYFVSMRYVYHQQFLKSGLDLNASTIGFLPAHAATFISDEFASRNKDDISIRNVSDNPRNPSNKADKFENEAIEYFKNNKNTKYLFYPIKKDNKEYFFYSKALVVEPYCIKCHGAKEQTLPYISRQYNSAFNYKIDDIRGITSIKIPKSIFQEIIDKTLRDIIIYNIIVIIMLSMIYYVIRRFTQKDVEYSAKLTMDVNEKTKELQNKTKELEISNEHQKHLYSILRTVADANQILITSHDLDDLLDKMGNCLISNDAFFSVKISLLEENTLTLKVSKGLHDSNTIFPIEEFVYANNQKIILTDFSDGLSQECLDYAKNHKVSSIYVSALKKDAYATQAIGTILICTTQQTGFDKDEIAMIDELAGDLGFAINSFYQKDHIVKLSYFDPLTDLANRRMLLEQLERAIYNSTRIKQYYALLFIDLDNFKTINDLKGHEAGDIVLIEMANRLKSIIRHYDTVSRYGGDEFVILLENLPYDKDHAASIVQKIAQKILDISKLSFKIDDQNFYISASIGMAIFNDNSQTADKILSSADNAMYAAKNSGKNRALFYDSKLQDSIERHSKMLQDLKNALHTNQLYMLYQEQFDDTNNIIGVEALMRWNHPEHGNIAPSVFIPLAEESSMIIELGEWVINEAIDKLIEWSKDIAKSNYHISINVSSKQFNEPNFVSILAKKAQIRELDPKKLRLELTESLLIDNIEDAMSKLQELRALGYTISIDDFGTGYSSLSYLKNLPIDELKIDQSFIKTLIENPSDQVIVKTIITIGETFNLDVIAEGVETKEQFEKLVELGCKYFQGYLFSKPKHMI